MYHLLIANNIVYLIFSLQRTRLISFNYYIHPIRYKWRQIGESLKISHGDLDSICDERSRNTDRLSDVIQTLFDKQPTVVSWHIIKIAVELPPVFEPYVAENIIHLFSPISNH